MAPKRPNTRANAQQNKRQKSNPPAIPDEVDAASPAQEEPGPSGDEAGDAGPLEGDGGADEYLGGDRGSVASSSLSSVSSTASRLSPVPSRSPLFSAVRPDSIKPTSARKSQGNTKPYRKAYLITSLSLTADQYAELTQAFANIYEGHLDLLEMNVAADSSAFCDRLNQIGLPANIINFLPVNKGFIMYHAALLGKAAYNARSTKTKIAVLIRTVASLQTTSVTTTESVAAIGAEQVEQRSAQANLKSRVGILEVAKVIAEEEFDTRIENIVAKNRVGIISDIENLLNRRDARK